jgi:hypothetical protein
MTGGDGRPGTQLEKLRELDRYLEETKKLNVSGS